MGLINKGKELAAKIEIHPVIRTVLGIIIGALGVRMVQTCMNTLDDAIGEMKANKEETKTS